MFPPKRLQSANTGAATGGLEFRLVVPVNPLMYQRKAACFSTGGFSFIEAD